MDDTPKPSGEKPYPMPKKPFTPEGKEEMKEALRLWMKVKKGLAPILKKDAPPPTD